MLDIIEGVGNEVTLFLAGVLSVLALAAVWRSTRVPPRPMRIQTIIVGGRVIHIDDVSGQQESDVSRDRSRQSDESRQQPAASQTLSLSVDVDEEVVLRQRRPNNDDVIDDQPISDDHVQRRADDVTDNDDVFAVAGDEENQPEEEDDDDDGNLITVKIKFLNDTERVVRGRCTESLALFIRRHFAVETRANRRVLLVYQGRRLQLTHTLSECGLSDNCVVHCHISSALSSSDGSNQHAANAASANESRLHRRQQERHADLNVGRLLWPLLHAFTCSAWLLFVLCPHVFSWLGGVLLAALTVPLWTVSLVHHRRRWLLRRRPSPSSPPHHSPTPRDQQHTHQR